MAMGLPVVSTFHSGIPELVEDGLSGLLVPERDVAALTSKLDYLVRNAQAWVRLGHAARARVESLYNLSALNAKLVDLCRPKPLGRAPNAAHRLP